MLPQKILISLLLLVQVAIAQKPVESVFPLKWKTYIGQTTYRHNILMHQNTLFVGSNGNTLQPIASDTNDAVFRINPKDGSILQKIEPLKKNKGEADYDVNGIATDGNRLYFGSDSKNLYCYDLLLKTMLWEYQTQYSESNTENIGNVESCPLLTDLNNDQENDVVITVRGKGVVAINGKNGKPLWVNVLSNNEGAFLSSPCVIDVNNDKIPDVITGGWQPDYISNVVALDGRNGKILWEYPLGSGLKSSPIILQKGKKTAIMVVSTYSVVHLIDLAGKLLYSLNFSSESGAISGMYASPTLTPNETMCIGSAWWSDDNDGLWVSTLKKANLSKVEGLLQVDNSFNKFYGVNRISASGVVAQITNKNWQIAVPTENGVLLLYDEKKKELEKFKLPAGSECTPFIADIDNDKKLELLIACYDGYLYCYELPLKKAKVFMGQFRQDNQNKATIKLN